MPLIEITDYTLAPIGSGQGLNGINFTLSPGDVYAVESQQPDDAHLFIRALATLARPITGTYYYGGKRVDFSTSKEPIDCKRKIGYIAPDAALISNLTIRQNLLLVQYYFSNDLTIDLDEKQKRLCRSFGIDTKLNHRPARLNAREIQAAVVIREVLKKPELLLLIHPEEFIGHEKFDLMTQFFNDWTAASKPVVFHSNDRRLVRRYAKRKVVISGDALTTIDMKRLRDA